MKDPLSDNVRHIHGTLATSLAQEVRRAIPLRDSQPVQRAARVTGHPATPQPR